MSRGPDRRDHVRAAALATLLGGSGVLHLVRPRVFEPLIPRLLRRPRPWVVVSGVAELVCAAGLVVPSWRWWGGRAAAVLLVAVLPGNLTMAVRPAGTVASCLAWARLPLQVPLVLWALRVARRRGI